jgi:hypothetical protein
MRTPATYVRYGSLVGGRRGEQDLDGEGVRGGRGKESNKSAFCQVSVFPLNRLTLIIVSKANKWNCARYFQQVACHFQKMLGWF